MRYTLLLHYPEMMADGQLSDEAIEQGQAAFNDYAKALNAAGVLVSAEVLQPTSATTSVSRKTGELVVQDGPFADTKEALGGSFVIDVADLDSALEWAGDAPSVQWGTVEIRPGATWFDTSADAWQGDARS
ncbi:YciI family protein [Glaciibacter flavus]|uniref:YciI family protein n=1 Tax=Orlajensenia flava TaxID=2565934 RepID=A0A4S4FU16_9MICO|nr:YciI family protein [Glaciibacter flavus]THG33841.1 YciI family protein [Glaciibacter flavus]